MNIPEITEISRLIIQPGDRIIVTVGADLTEEHADVIKGRIKARLDIPDSVRLLIVPDSIRFQVVGADL